MKLAEQYEDKGEPGMSEIAWLGYKLALVRTRISNSTLDCLIEFPLVCKDLSLFVTGLGS